MGNDAAAQHLWVSAHIEKARKPEQRRVAVRAAQGLAECGQHIIKQGIIAPQNGLLNALLRNRQGDVNLPVLDRRGQCRQFQSVERHANIAVGDIGKMLQRVCVRLYVHLAKPAFLVLDGVVQNIQHIFARQGMKSEHPTAGHDGGSHGNHGIFRCRTDEANQPLLHRGKDTVALRLGPAVAFVQEKIGRLAVHPPALRSFFERIPHIGHAGGDCVHFDERGAGHVRNDGSQGGLAAAGRPVKNAARQAVSLNRPPQKTAGTDNIPLAVKFIQIPCTHPVRQRR